VIIPYRNEAEHLRACINSVLAQDYPGEFEIILSDDHSTDGSHKIVSSYSMNSKIILVSSTGEGKKAALLSGIKQSGFSALLTLDADSVAPPCWLRKMSELYAGKKMLCGPVTLVGKGLFSELQKAESAAVVGISCATLNLGFPTTCNGSNLMFDKEEFLSLGGYRNHMAVSSGDDDILMQMFYRKDHSSVAYTLDGEALVRSRATTNIQNLLSQRSRWLSKSPHYSYLYNRYLQVFIAIHLIAFYVVMFYLISKPEISIPLVLIKFFPDTIYSIRLKKFIPHSFLSVLIMPFYLLYIFALPFYGSKKNMWKGREVKS
jgi:glycosyltransferase involved in cell wall biosynthesis